MGCDHKVISNLKLYSTVQLPKLVNRSLLTILRDGRDQRNVKLWSRYFIVFSYAAIAILPSYCLYAFSLSQLNNAFAVALFSQIFYSLKTKVKQKTFDRLTAKSVLCMCVCVCAIRQFYFQNAIVVDTAYLQILNSPFYLLASE